MTHTQHINDVMSNGGALILLFWMVVLIAVEWKERRDKKK